MVTLSDYPLDLLFEVLIRLPDNALRRVKSVCKKWRSLIEDPLFVTSHIAKNSGHWVFSSMSPNNVRSPSDIGLIVENSEIGYWLRNPITRQIFYLPHPGENLMAEIKICHMHSTGELKLVVPREERYMEKRVCGVLTVGVDNAWRNIDFVFPGNLINFMFGPAIVVREVYFVLCMNRKNNDLEIVCMEMGSEQISRIKVPRSCSVNVVPVAWEHRLSLVSVTKGIAHVCVLEDHKKTRWVERRIVLPLKFVKETKYSFAFKGDHMAIHSSFSEMLLFDIVSGEVTEPFCAPKGHGFICNNASTV